MKHLKLFESVSESDFDDVKDIFQDIVDEYDIYKISMHSGAQTLSSGLYYAYKFITGNASYNKSNSFRIEIYLINESKRLGLRINETQFDEDINKLKHDLENFKNRITQIGFDVEFRNELNCEMLLSGVDIIIRLNAF